MKCLYSSRHTAPNYSPSGMDSSWSHGEWAMSTMRWCVLTGEGQHRFNTSTSSKPGERHSLFPWWQRWQREMSWGLRCPNPPILQRSSVVTISHCPRQQIWPGCSSITLMCNPCLAHGPHAAPYWDTPRHGGAFMALSVTRTQEKVNQEALVAMLKVGVKEESNSAWCSPIFLVAKKDGAVWWQLQGCLPQTQDKKEVRQFLGIWPAPWLTSLERVPQIRSSGCSHASWFLRRSNKPSVGSLSSTHLTFLSLFSCRPMLRTGGWARCSDHAPLQWLHHIKDANGHITHWYLALQPFKFRVVQ